MGSPKGIENEEVIRKYKNVGIHKIIASKTK
jgi:hypothetical protein